MKLCKPRYIIALAFVTMLMSWQSVAAGVASDIRTHRYTTDHWIFTLMEDLSGREVFEGRYSWTDNSRERAKKELADRVRWWPGSFGSGKYAEVITTMLLADREPVTVTAQWRDLLEETYEPAALHHRALEVMEYIGAHVFMEQMQAQGDQAIFDELLGRFPEIGELLAAEEAVRDPRNAKPRAKQAIGQLAGRSEPDHRNALNIINEMGPDAFVKVLGERDLLEAFGHIVALFESTLDPKTWEKAFDTAEGILSVLEEQNHPRTHLFEAERDRNLLPAFPGARGAGKYARGGRGGDVYHVTNLNDSGPGSFRYGLETAEGPRTIVFDVAGTIFLDSRLSISGKPFLTIAGQTAPGQGITLANSDVRFSECDHLIIQNIRIAPGDTFTRQGSEGKSDHRPRGKMNGLRVSKSDFVMIDHLVIKWTTEQALSVTTGHSGGRLPTDPNSRNTTVQYSMIVEAFFDGDHHKGERGFATYIRGNHSQTWHHNLFVHNASRTPKIGHVQAEWVNNVLYNGNVGYTNQRVHSAMNYAGNVYIDGPDDPYGVGPFLYSTDPASDSNQEAFASNFLFYSTSPYHYIYHSAPDQLDRNYLDPWKDHPFELIPAPDHAVGAREYTRFNQPFDISDYQIRTGREAYIDVMSRSGTHMRDLHDHRIIREVITKSGTFIDRQSDLEEVYGIEAWPEPDSAETVKSTARDGIADGWKEKHGLNIHKAYHQKRTPEGYTWLEKYFHTLTRHAYLSERSVSHTFRPESVKNRDDYVVLIFDLSEVAPGSLRDARLQLGLKDATDQDESAHIYAKDYRWAGSRSVTEYEDIAGYSNLLRLGLLNIHSGTTLHFDNPNLPVFLNTGSYHPEDPERHRLMLVIDSLKAQPDPMETKLVIY